MIFPRWVEAAPSSAPRWVSYMGCSPEGWRSTCSPIVHPDSAVELSWLLVLVRASDMSGTARVVLTSGDRRIELPPLRFSRMGDADTWFVTSSSITGFDHVQLLSSSGELLASGSISGD